VFFRANKLFLSLYLKCAALLPVGYLKQEYVHRMSVADISISQGSVATRLKCGGIFKSDCCSLTMK